MFHKKGNSIVIMGVSGSGKTTVGKAVAAEYGCRFVDGDDLHPPANISKMHAGIPLTDADRWGWLQRINQEMHTLNTAGISVVVACSALKRKYRELLRQHGLSLLFLYLKGNLNQVDALLEKREGHFMPAGLLKSQFETLEEPAGEETDCIAIPITDLREELEQILAVLRQHGFS
ncbi:gluconokinase [Niabella sp. CC-SYL272]|uniref:gluconokinase n=1 Tax=Niabella agricola TaxID=2891571 RepID=UPI001F274963|nr:gluconokinase [Niabella agricola]MCF3109643.1 gluconokinase [Niabella agricola]